MHNAPLIIFDSGIGGFSILKELLRYETPLYYFADQANFPYGDKSLEFLQHRFVELSEIFASLSGSGLVVACNTGTVTALPYLRGELSIPVFGVEPVTKMLKEHQNPVVWGTTVTTSSDVAINLKNAHGDHIRYYTPVGLASAIEANDLSSVSSILNSAKNELGDVDAIGLSCTHYPLVKNLIQEIFTGVTIYDPSSAVARHVARTLKLSLITDQSIKSTVNYHSTSSVLRLQQLADIYGLL